MEEKGIRQDGDHRVCGCVKDPVVIIKENMVKGDKGLFPVEADKDSKDHRNGNGQYGSVFKKTPVFFLPLPYNSCCPKDQRNHTGDLYGNKDRLHFLKVDPAAVRHGQGWKFQSVRAEDGIVINEYVIVLTDLIFWITGSLGNIQMAYIKIIQGPKVQGKYNGKGNDEKDEDQSKNDLYPGLADFFFVHKYSPPGSNAAENAVVAWASKDLLTP